MRAQKEIIPTHHNLFVSGRAQRSLFPVVLQVLFTVIILQQAGCEKAVGPPDQEPEEVSPGILPLKVGYSWEYQTYALNEDSTIGPAQGRDKFKVIRTSLDSSQSGGDVLFHRVYVDPYTNTESEFEWLFRNYEDGLYAMGGRMTTDSIYTRLLYLKYPVKKGESWKSPHLIYHLIEQRYTIQDSIAYTCIDTNTVFETSTGRFSCVVYYHREKWDDGDATSTRDIYEYCSKEVGIIATITSIVDNSGKSYPYSRRILIETNVFANKQ